VIRSFRSRQFATFIFTGAIAALVNFFSRLAYDQWMSFSAAVVCAYVSGMITAFILAKAFVFTEPTHSMRRSVLIFTAVNLAAVAQTWVVSMVLAYYVLPWLGVTHFVPEIAHAIGIVVPVFTSYLGHKHWTFRSA
jgi:putative flippase GtrA